jgi:predicted DNA-binding protein with PD1-like motif
MQYKKFEAEYMLRLDAGEDIVEGLKDFCNENGIRAGKVSGIGAIHQVTISFFDVQNGVFIDKEIPAEVEMLSLMGNISMMEGEIYPHLHVTLSDENFNIFGGHLSAGIVNATAELFIKVYDWTMERKYYPQTGFRLLALED